MQAPLIENSEKKNRSSTTLVTATRVFSTPMPDLNPYLPNRISTSKYNCITFLPKNLWAQFHKVANVYFLILATLQSIPQVSNSGGYPTILIPLLLVLFISGVKDLSEDNKRKKSDNEENNKKVLLRRNKSWESIMWADLRVGEFVRIERNQYFPADIALLVSSDPKGMCYVETKNLDGETNLKHKLAEKFSQSFLSDDKIDSFQCEIKCDDPNPMIYSFNGLFKYNNNYMPLGHEQILLRGSSLKNTDWVVGIVIYTGHETKIMLNSPKSRVKYSSLEAKMNMEIVKVFIFQIILCTFCASFYTGWFFLQKDDTEGYLKLNHGNTNGFAVFIVSLFSWMLLFGNFVPISLLVTLETVKFFQAILISKDLGIYYELNDMPAGVQSSNLNEDLGQINYIFSDKTGTLTCNVMEFKKITIAGETFGTDEHVDINKKLPHVDFVDPSFNPKTELAREFLLHLAVCHTIISEEKDGKIEYKASSPDELALVNAAKYFGVEFSGRDENQNVLVKIDNKIISIAILNIIEFNSDRKRMTVVVRLPNGTIKLLCKGADTVILPRLQSENFKEKTIENLESYANEGLRTLVIASKDMEENEYHEWNKKYSEAVQDLLHKEKRIDEVAELLEVDLKLLGATAIEDKLQDNVPETIKIIREAGVKIWVLTGDKVETAINIGFSCNLLSNEMIRITVVGTKTHVVEEELDDGVASFKEARGSVCALIISGEALIRALKPELKVKLLELTENCSVVLACRVSPQQKADIVKLIRDAKPHCRTLGIGDGANDVNMITAAHVGIGIAGLEGKQAVRASDYSIAQFSYLKRLMFLHGRECYRRNANLICYNFYKNVLLVMPLFFYGTLSVFSAQSFYNTWILQFFNLFYSAGPIILYAVFDHELENDELLQNPAHYKLGLDGNLFKTSRFWLWIIEAILQALFVLFCCAYGIGKVSGFSSGHMSSMTVVSIMIVGVVVILVNIKVFLMSYSHYWFTIATLIFGVLSYFAISSLFFEGFPVKEFLQNFDGYGGINQIFANPNSYILILILAYGSFYLIPIINAFLKTIKLLKKDKIVYQEHELYLSHDIEPPSDPERASRIRKSLLQFSKRRKI
jgi:phospholipid-transporting ATPase